MPATAPSTVNVGFDWGVLVLKTCGRKRSGRMPVRRAFTSSVASQVGRKRTGAGVEASGSGRAGTSSSTPPCSSRKRRSSMFSSAGFSSAGGIPAQLTMSATAAGPKARR